MLYRVSSNGGFQRIQETDADDNTPERKVSDCAKRNMIGLMMFFGLAATIIIVTGIHYIGSGELTPAYLIAFPIVVLYGHCISKAPCSSIGGSDSSEPGAIQNV